MAQIATKTGQQNVAMLGVGACRPQRVITNDELCKTLDSTDEWIFERSGIRSRRWISGDESNRSMSVTAAERGRSSTAVSTGRRSTASSWPPAPGPRSPARRPVGGLPTSVSTVCPPSTSSPAAEASATECRSRVR